MQCPDNSVVIVFCGQASSSPPLQIGTEQDPQTGNGADLVEL